MNARYSIIHALPGEMYLLQCESANNPGTPTLVEDAAAVISHLLEMHGNEDYIVRTPDGKWHLLIHDTKKFVKVETAPPEIAESIEAIASFSPEELAAALNQPSFPRNKAPGAFTEAFLASYKQAS